MKLHKKVIADGDRLRVQLHVTAKPKGRARINTRNTGHNTMSRHTHSLADITDAMREHDRHHAPGSESAQWQAFVDESRRAYKVDPFDDEAGEIAVSHDFAAYWLAIAECSYNIAEQYSDVPAEWRGDNEDDDFANAEIDLEIFADRMGETDEAEALASEYADWLENEVKREYPSADVSIVYVPNHAGAARSNVFADTLADEESIRHFIDQCCPRFLENKFSVDE